MIKKLSALVLDIARSVTRSCEDCPLNPSQKALLYLMGLSNTVLVRGYDSAYQQKVLTRISTRLFVLATNNTELDYPTRTKMYELCFELDQFCEFELDTNSYRASPSLFPLFQH
jgi:hypothetical protein